MRNDYQWTLVKWISVIFNSISTWNVFYGVLQQNNSELVAVVGTISAIALIDILFVFLVSVLLSPLEENETYRMRKPYAVGLVTLYVGILVIGLQDEGWLAIAPRVGLGIITLIALYAYWLHARYESDMYWQDEFERERYRQERKDAENLRKIQRKIKNKERQRALKLVKDEIREKYVSDYRRDLNLGSPQIIDVRPKALESGTSISESDYEAQDYIYPISDGYGWRCPICGISQETTAAGEPLKERGAKIQFSKHIKTCPERR